ncbi:MAG: glycosyltransferase family 9 protein [bacterium]|nr:glycosyltransferase family 9 protein [bacterium]
MTKFPVPAKRILVIQLRQVGDVLLTTPAVKVLRDCYPDSTIGYLTEKGPAALLQGNPHIDRLFIRDRKGGFRQDAELMCALRKEKFDLAIDFFCNPRSAWLSFVSGAPHRVANYHAGRSWFYSETPKITAGIDYAVYDKLALLKAIGVEGALVPPVLRVPDAARHYIGDFFTKWGIPKKDERNARPIITIDPTSRRQAKRWIPERYVQLADRFVERYKAKVIFLWGPGEKEMVETLLQGGKYRHLLACPTDLMQLAALIENSDLHVGNCSAPRHIAVALGTPSLTVMGPTIPENWTYPSPMHRVVRGNVPCLECQQTVCETHECMKALTVPELEKVVEDLFSLETCA